MYQLIDKFVEYCRMNLDLTESETYNYRSLPICIIDCVYSLRAKYYSVTVPITKRYAAAYMNGDTHAKGDTVSQFLQHVDEIGGPEAFASKVLKNHQQLGGKAHIPKEQVCYKLAQYLSYLQIESIEDFQQFKSQELLEIVIRAVKGLGDAGTNYLFMLAGDANRCKTDVHIHRCIKDACGVNISNDDCQKLFVEAVSILKEDYPSLTVRKLDGIIWRKYQNQK